MRPANEPFITHRPGRKTRGDTLPVSRGYFSGVNALKNARAESFWFASLLTLTGGFLDAYTFCCRDGVFSNAQTGNIVQVGIALARGDLHGIVRYFIPIVAFTCGVLLAMYIRDRSRGGPELWQRRILLMEIAVAAAVGFIPSGHMLNIAANVMISFLCALQYEAFRKVSGKAFASTMCTGNLRSGSECLYQAITAGDRAKRRDAAHYFGIILVFIAGAAIGVLVTNLLSEAAVFAAVLPLAVAFVCLR